MVLNVVPLAARFGDWGIGTERALREAYDLVRVSRDRLVNLRSLLEGLSVKNRSGTSTATDRAAAFALARAERRMVPSHGGSVLSLFRTLVGLNEELRGTARDPMDDELVERLNAADGGDIRVQALRNLGRRALALADTIRTRNEVESRAFRISSTLVDAHALDLASSAQMAFRETVELFTQFDQQGKLKGYFEKLLEPVRKDGVMTWADAGNLETGLAFSTLYKHNVTSWSDDMIRTFLATAVPSQTIGADQIKNFKGLMQSTFGVLTIPRRAQAAVTDVAARAIQFVRSESGFDAIEAGLLAAGPTWGIIYSTIKAGVKTAKWMLWNAAVAVVRIGQTLEYVRKNINEWVDTFVVFAKEFLLDTFDPFRVLTGPSRFEKAYDQLMPTSDNKDEFENKYREFLSTPLAETLTDDPVFYATVRLWMAFKTSEEIERDLGITDKTLFQRVWKILTDSFATVSEVVKRSLNPYALDDFVAKFEKYGITEQMTVSVAALVVAHNNSVALEKGYDQLRTKIKNVLDIVFEFTLTDGEKPDVTQARMLSMIDEDQREFVEELLGTIGWFLNVQTVPDFVQSVWVSFLARMTGKAAKFADLNRLFQVVRAFDPVRPTIPDTFDSKDMIGNLNAEMRPSVVALDYVSLWMTNVVLTDSAWGAGSGVIP